METMGRRRLLSRFMFGVDFLIWMASTVLFCENPSACLWSVAPSQLMQRSSEVFNGAVHCALGECIYLVCGLRPPGR